MKNVYSSKNFNVWSKFSLKQTTMGKSFFISVILAIALIDIIGCSKEDFTNEEEITDPIVDPDGQGPIDGGTYYVATWGNNANDGSFEKPWATWQKAINMAKAGDTVYIRGGVFYPTTTIEISPRDGKGRNGTYYNYVHFLNYPGETPVFDFVNSNPPGNYSDGIDLTYANFIHIKGVTIRNVQQKKDNVEVLGFYANNSSNLLIENVSIHDCGGNAFRYAGAMGYYGINYDSTYFINCDAYNNCDAKPREPGATLGGAADGFKSWNEPGSYLVFRGCRAWNNSDDGFDPGTDVVTIIDNCWSFNNGLLDGDGTGFKTGGMWHDNGSKITREVTNCIAAGNTASGFFLLEYPDYFRTNARIYNNFSYANEGSGFSVSRNEARPKILAIWKNNIAFANESFPFMNAYQEYAESNNSWKRVDGYPGYENRYNLTAADFLSLDINELDNPRKDDGSLPDVNFGHLNSTSKLKKAGTNIGMSQIPDIGIDWNYLDKK